MQLQLDHSIVRPWEQKFPRSLTRYFEASKQAANNDSLSTVPASNVVLYDKIPSQVES